MAFSMLTCPEDMEGFNGLSHLSFNRVHDFSQIASILESERSRIRLKINTNKTEFLNATGHHTHSIYVNGQNTEIDNRIVYQGKGVRAKGVTDAA